MIRMYDALRSWFAERRRANRKLRKLKAADVVIISHAKSGRTWLRAMISHLYHQKYGLPQSELVDFDSFLNLNVDIPKILFTHVLNEPREFNEAMARKLREGLKGILLARDPRDVAVSYYYHHAKRSKPAVRERLGIPDDVAAVPLFDFMMNESYGLPNIVDFLNRWGRDFAGYPHALVVKYEDLHANPDQTLRRVMALIGGDFSDEEIAGAVQFASFNALKEKESTNFFDSGRLQARDQDDPDSYKVRKGKVHGYVDYFSADEIASIDGFVRTQLSPEYGYGASDPRGLDEDSSRDRLHG